MTQTRHQCFMRNYSVNMTINNPIIQKIMKKQEIIALAKENDAEVAVYTYATANQTDVSYHTDCCQYVGDEDSIPENEDDILDVSYMDRDGLNETLYANSSEYALDDEKLMCVFISGLEPERE